MDTKDRKEYIPIEDDEVMVQFKTIGPLLTTFVFLLFFLEVVNGMCIPYYISLCCLLHFYGKCVCVYISMLIYETHARHSYCPFLCIGIRYIFLILY